MKTLTAWHRVGNLVRLMPPAKAEKVRAAWRQKFREGVPARAADPDGAAGETAVSSVSRGAGRGRGASAARAQGALCPQAALCPAGTGTGLEASGGPGWLGTAR